MNFEKDTVISEPTPVQPPKRSPRYGTLSVFELGHLLPDQHQGRENAAELECRQVQHFETQALQAAMEQAGIYPPQDVLRRFEVGRTAHVGEIRSAEGGAVMVTYGWVALNAEPLGNTGCAFEPPQGDAWLYDFATLPDYRGHGYYPTLLRFILTDLAAQGLRRAWIGTEPGNDISARSIARAGFHKVADTKYIPRQPEHPARFDLLPVPGISLALVELGQKAHVAA